MTRRECDCDSGTAACPTCGRWYSYPIYCTFHAEKYNAEPGPQVGHGCPQHDCEPYQADKPLKFNVSDTEYREGGCPQCGRHMKTVTHYIGKEGAVAFCAICSMTYVIWPDGKVPDYAT